MRAWFPVNRRARSVVAGGLSAGLVAAGFLMVAGHPATQNVFALYAEYARSFFSGSSYSVLVS